MTNIYSFGFAILLYLTQSLAAQEPAPLFTISSENLNCCQLSESDFDDLVLAYKPRKQDVRHLEGILSHTGLQPNFIFARSPSIGYNAVALMRGRQRVVLYSEKLLDDLASETKTNFSPVAILAHEIGHHLQGHVLYGGGSTPPAELQADRFAGYVLARMGAKLEQATSTFEKIASENGSATHPPRYARVAAVTDGWKRAQEHIKKQIAAAALEPSEATYLRIDQTAKETSPGIWQWSAWIDADAASLARIQSVTWKLHELLPEPVRETTNKASLFEVSEITKGSFPLKAEIKNSDETTENLRTQLILKKP